MSAIAAQGGAGPDGATNWLLALGIAAALPMGATVPHALNPLALLVALLGFTLSPRAYRDAPSELATVRNLYIAYVAVALLSLLKTDNFDFAGWRLERYYPFLLMIPLLYRFQAHAAFFRIVAAVAVTLSGVALGLAAAYGEMFTDVDRLGRYAAFNPDTFGHIAGCVCVVSVPFAWGMRHKARALSAALFLAGSSALFAAQASGSRGVLLAAALSALVVCVAVVLRARGRRRASPRAGWYAIAVVVLLTAALYGVYDRFLAIPSEVARFASGDYTATSVGARLFQWWGAAIIFVRNPLLGTGIGDPLDDFRGLKATGALPDITKIDHAIFHNAFADIAATTGVLGLVVASTALFAYPFYLSCKRLRRDGTGLSAVLMALISFNFFAAFTNSWPFLRSLPFVLLLMTIFLPLVIAERR